MSEERSRYSTHVLELIRNNGISSKESEKSNVQARFLMFDYFDILLYRKLEGADKTYLNYFSIGDPFGDDKDYKVSYKTLSLYCQASEKENNPFLGNSEGEEAEIPFLGLIQISLCFENYAKDKEHYEDMEVFLQGCEKEIWKWADGKDGMHKDPLVMMQLYRSSTTGDFCLAVRADAVEKIYSIALALSDTQSNPDIDLKMLTYTNVGIACRVLEDGRYGTLSPKFVQEHKHMAFALRFSADLDIMKILKQYQRSRKRGEDQEDGTLGAFKGLLGRYDYLLRLDMEEFAEICPVLCEKKFGRPGSETEVYKNGDLTLKNILRYPYIRNVNERVLISMKDFGKGDLEEKGANNDYLEKVLEKNQALFEKIENLEKWKYYFSEEDRAFRDLYRGMKQIYKTYSAIGMEKEAYINWLMFCKDIEILCGCINRSMEKYEVSCKDENWKREKGMQYRSRLLKDWRINIQAINQYTRLIQNINYQTYQSPIYELQTQIDTEKVIVAYKEAMKLFTDSYTEWGKDGTKESAEIIPVIYPDLSRDKVEVIAPFSGERKGEERAKREIICMVPSFEYFGRLYDLLPWIFHESAHHLRVLGRKERNQFLVKYIFSYLYRVIMENALPKTAGEKWYVVPGRTEQVLIETMTEVTEKDFEDMEDFAEFGFAKVIAEIERYLEKIFPYGAGYGGKRHLYKEKELSKAVTDFYVREYREEGLLNEESLELILALRTVPEAQEILTEKLLNQYTRRILNTEEGPVPKKAFFQNQDRFEEELGKAGEVLLNVRVSEDAVREYCFKLANLYRIFQVYYVVEPENIRREDTVENYLQRVFEKYQEEAYEKSGVRERLLKGDPSVMYFLRSLGLLSGDKNVFCSRMTEIFQEADFKEIKQYKDDRIKVYREAFADLLMTASLHIGSFGYCRQVLQTISDARVEEKQYAYDDINYRRFQIVTAVLLAEEQGITAKEEGEAGEIRLDGSSIAEKGKVYCEYMLKCICQKLMETEVFAENEEKKDLVRLFAGKINLQMCRYLENMGEDGSYASTFLYVLLHGKEGADAAILEAWRKFEELREACQPILYLFWRVEHFCLGLEKIMQEGYVAVGRDIFCHMNGIREKIQEWEKTGKGRSKKEPSCLLGARMDVSQFYNDPCLVYEKKTQQKLETTIDFIQNYYYYNRFHVMEGEEVCV